MKSLTTLKDDLELPVIAAPMFIISGPELLIAQCKSGIVGSLPALNARPQSLLHDWLTCIKAELSAHSASSTKPAAPYAINLIVHQSNDRLNDDLNTCVQHQVPIIITSLRAPPPELIDKVHSYGGKVLHDVINVRHARKAAQAGVDGLILVCAGAGGHAGAHSPFALVAEVREFFDGAIALSGSICNGRSILAARTLGADFAYIGTRFIASEEANASMKYKEMLIESSASDILWTPHFTGVHGNYLKPSISAAGLDPDNLEPKTSATMEFGSKRSEKRKAWRDIWGSGQGLGAIHDAPSSKHIVARLKEEYLTALRELRQY